MPLIKRQHFAGYTFDLSFEANAEQLETMVRLVERVPERRPGKLSGRRGVGFGVLEPYGRVVVKHYSRGGVYRHLVEQRYVGFGHTRAQKEFYLLELVRGLGVSAPMPLAAVKRGWGIYRNWLFSSEICDQRSLAEISVSDAGRTMPLLRKLSDQLAALIESGVLHVDLHPGNVLVDGQETIYLIDFDKAVRGKYSKEELRNQYLTRWRRAVIKHELPDELSEGLCHLLRTR